MAKKINLTELEVKVARMFAQTSIDICNCFCEEENLSYMNAQDIAEQAGMSLQAVGGVMASLSNKCLIVDCMESSRGARINDFIASNELYLDYPELKDLVIGYDD